MTPIFVFLAWTISFMGVSHITQKQCSQNLYSIKKEEISNDNIVDKNIDKQEKNIFERIIFERMDENIFDEYNIINKESMLKKICSNTKDPQYDKHYGYYCEKLNTMLFCLKNAKSKEDVLKARERIANNNNALEEDFAAIGIDSICGKYDNKMHFSKEKDYWSLSRNINHILKNETDKRKIYEIKNCIADIKKIKSDWDEQ